MLNLTIPLGKHFAQQFEALQQIKDAQVMAILNHPAFQELVNEDNDLRTCEMLYNEAQTVVNNLNNNLVDG